MSLRNDLVFVQHILNAIRKSLAYTANLTETEFMSNTLVQDGVVRQFEIIGEAAKKVSPGYREQHKGVPWSHMAKMRDVLIHHYWEVDLVVVWTTLNRDLPRLAAQLETLVSPD